VSPASSVLASRDPTPRTTPDQRKTTGAPQPAPPNTKTAGNVNVRSITRRMAQTAVAANDSEDSSEEESEDSSDDDDDD
jgi:hypothetical protein